MEGFVSVSRITERGRIITPAEIARRNLVVSSCEAPKGWKLQPHEIPLAKNMFVDTGRQALAYLFGGRTPASSYSCSRFGIGTSTDASNVALSDLVSPIDFYDSGSGPLKPVKPINGVDFPDPYIARVEFTIGETEAGGYLITELGLYAQEASSGVNILLCREVNAGWQKEEGVSRTFTWRIRF